MRARLCEVQGLAVEVGEGGAVFITCPSPALAVETLRGLVEAAEEFLRSGDEVKFSPTCKAARDVLDSGHRAAAESVARFALPPVAEVAVADPELLCATLADALDRVVERRGPEKSFHDEEVVGEGPLRAGVLMEAGDWYVTLRAPGAFLSRQRAPHAVVLLAALRVADEEYPAPSREPS